jgi:hypothetical protein
MAATIATAAGVSPGLPGGQSSALNLTAAQVIKPAPGVLVTIVCVTPGTGSLTFNDVLTVGAAAAANEIITLAAPAAGAVIALNWPCAVGIVASSVPTGGQYSVAFS